MQCLASPHPFNWMSPTLHAINPNGTEHTDTSSYHPSPPFYILLNYLHSQNASATTGVAFFWINSVHSDVRHSRFSRLKSSSRPTV